MWIMAQSWDELLFAHWPIGVDQLRRVVPPQLEVDTFADQAWLGVVAFRISAIHLPGLPALPGLARFPEVNLRTYVRHNGRPGVLFLSLHCSNRLAMAIARPWFRLPYQYADVCLAPDGDTVDFASRSRSGASFVARYRPLSEACAARPGSLEEWLTERYCYYTAVPEGRLYRGAIDHAPWMLARANAEIGTNTLAVPFGLNLPETPPLV